MTTNDLALGVGLGVAVAGVLTAICLWAFASFVWHDSGPPPPPPPDKG